jgi:hypothetical protein
MAEAVTFCAVVTLTMAWLLPLADYSRAARCRWRCGYCLFAVYGVLLESAQAFRGRDPRFSEVGGAVDSVTGSVFSPGWSLREVTRLVGEGLADEIEHRRTSGQRLH